MKKSILAASLSAALCLLTSHSVMAQDIFIDSSRTVTATGNQVGTTAYKADGTATFKGASDIDYTLDGGWFRGFAADGSTNSWEISNFNNFTVEFTNPNYQGDSIGLMAKDNGSIYLHNIANVSITNLQDQVVVGATDAIPIHAWNGSVKMENVGNVTISSGNFGNAIMVQGAKGSVDIDAEGDIRISSNDFAVVVAPFSFSATPGDITPSLSLNGRTIDISSRNFDALQVYDSWAKQSYPGNINIELTAKDSIRLDGRRFGILQNRDCESQPNTVKTVISAPTVEISGQQGAILTQQKEKGQIDFRITIDAQSVNLTSDGTSATVATLELGKHTNIEFVNTNSTARSQVRIAAAAGDAVDLSQDANLSFTNADVNVAQGNVTGEGTVVLNDTTLNLAENVTMSMDTVKGEGAQVVFNTARENAVQITHADKNVAVLASGDLNDRYGEEALGFINADNATTGAQAGKVRGAIVEQADGSHVVEQNTAMTALEQMNASTLVQFRLENNRLSQRLGEVRDNLNKAGGWARVYGAKSRLSDSIDSTIKTNSIQVGADATIGNNWIVGGAFSYTNMDADFSNGNGESDSYMLSAYASGFFDCGGYVDIIGRVGRLSTDLNASSGPSVEAFDGSYDNTAFGLSTEVGYHWKLSDVFFIEPQAELAYGYVLGDDYTSSNDVKVKQDDFQSLVGRLGTRLGAAFPKDAGIIYAHASVNHDFLGDNDFTAQAAGMTSAMKFSNDLDETWVSYGIGLQLNPSKNFYVYGSLDRATGSDYAESYHYSVGARYVF